MSSPDPFLKLAADARRNIPEVSVEEFMQGRVDPQHVLIDVRENDEWQAGHAASARHLSRGLIEQKIVEVVPDVNTPIICYCGGGHRSALAAESLQRMGYTQVKALAGGFAAWQKARLPVVPGGANRPL